jgi:hypothetical protein
MRAVGNLKMDYLVMRFKLIDRDIVERGDEAHQHKEIFKEVFGFPKDFTPKLWGSGTFFDDGEGLTGIFFEDIIKLDIKGEKFALEHNVFSKVSEFSRRLKEKYKTEHWVSWIDVCQDFADSRDQIEGYFQNFRNKSHYFDGVRQSPAMRFNPKGQATGFTVYGKHWSFIIYDKLEDLKSQGSARKKEAYKEFFKDQYGFGETVNRLEIKLRSKAMCEKFLKADLFSVEDPSDILKIAFAEFYQAHRLIKRNKNKKEICPTMEKIFRLPFTNEQPKQKAKEGL